MDDEAGNEASFASSVQRSRRDALEIGGQAVWSLSSCKAGYGVTQLRDNSTETYWQSDGPQPHLINIEFLKKTAVKCISIYTDYSQDESYTPKKISLRAGSHFHDLSQVKIVEFDEPDGWVDISVLDSNERPVKAFLFQIKVLGNHQHGRDTHIRQVKVFEPEPNELMHLNQETAFESADFVSMQI